MTRRTATLIAVGAMVVAVLAGVWFASSRGVSAASAVNGAVTIECTGSTRVTPAACGEWGDTILAADSAPRTFEREDLRRLRLDRAFLGLGAECRVEWFLSRYPDSPVWSDGVACR